MMSPPNLRGVLQRSPFSDPVWGRSRLSSTTCSVIPRRKRWTHCPFASSCHAAPFPLLTVWLPQSGVKLSPFFSCQVPQRWNLSSACLALESYSGIVLWIQHTHRAEQTKPRTEEAHQTVVEAERTALHLPAVGDLAPLMHCQLSRISCNKSN